MTAQRFSEPPDLTEAGSVAKPHGVRGELCVDLFTDSPAFLDGVVDLFLQAAEGPPRLFALLSWREHHGRVLVRLKGVEDRNQADTLRGCVVLLRTGDLPPLGEDEVYLHELIGCQVSLPDGADLGVIRDILPTSAEQEVWSIETPDGREVLFPAHEDSVLDVDLEQRRIRIEPPQGLLDIYLSEQD